MAIGLRAGDVVSSITVCVSAAGATVTLSKVGLYDKAGNRLALSADQGTAWQSTGNLVVPLITPYQVLADDGFFVAIVSKASVTLPTLLRVSTNSFQSGAIGSGQRLFGTQTAQTDLPASATITTGSPTLYWAAIS